MRSKLDVPNELECKSCHGQGYTHQTAPVLATHDGKPVTKLLGSGCPECLGTGRV
jgi:DnaJ-class molecular chaperone